MREGRYYTQCIVLLTRGGLSIVQASTCFSQQREGTWLLSTIPTLLNTLLFSLTGHDCGVYTMQRNFYYYYYFLLLTSTLHTIQFTSRFIQPYYLKQILFFTYYYFLYYYYYYLLWGRFKKRTQNYFLFNYHNYLSHFNYYY